MKPIYVYDDLAERIEHLSDITDEHEATIADVVFGEYTDEEIVDMLL